MDKHQHQYCQPVLPLNGIEAVPFIDFTSGYIIRALDKIPKQGREKPWRLNQNYILDRMSLSYSSVVDNSIIFSSINPTNSNSSSS
jgi:hypothetical protein